MASRSNLVPPKTAPPQVSSRASYGVNPYDPYGSPRRSSTSTSTQAKQQHEQKRCFAEILHTQIVVATRKSRLRAGRVTDPTNPLRRVDYEKHRERVQTAQAKVDSSCPIVPKALYVNSTAFNQKIASFSRIERENAVLLRRIAAILEGNGSIDNRLRQTTKNTNNRARARQHSLLQMTFANLALVKRIEEQRPAYSRKEQLKDYARMEKVMAAMSYYPLFWKNKTCHA